jgi:hypothetical protein
MRGGIKFSIGECGTRILRVIHGRDAPTTSPGNYDPSLTTVIAISTPRDALLQTSKTHVEDETSLSAP